MSALCFSLPSGVEAHHVQFDFYGKVVAVACSDGVVRLYDCSEGAKAETPLCELTGGHSASVWQVAWSHPRFNGGMLASCGYDRKVILWREAAPKKWEQAFVSEAHELSVNALSFGPEQHGLILGCASSDGSISIIRYQDGQWLSQRCAAHNMGVNAIAFAPAVTVLEDRPSALMTPFFDSALAGGGPAVRFATGGCDDQIKIWRFDLASGGAVCEEALKKHSGWVRALAWTECPGFPGGALASGGADGKVCVWRSVSPGKAFQVSFLPPFNEEVWDLSWSGEGSLGKEPTLAVTTGSGTSFWRFRSQADSSERKLSSSSGTVGSWEMVDA